MLAYCRLVTDNPTLEFLPRPLVGRTLNGKIQGSNNEVMLRIESDPPDYRLGHDGAPFLVEFRPLQISVDLVFSQRNPVEGDIIEVEGTLLFVECINKPTYFETEPPNFRTRIKSFLKGLIGNL